MVSFIQPVLQEFAESQTNAGLSRFRCANNDMDRKHVKQTEEFRLSKELGNGKSIKSGKELT